MTGTGAATVAVGKEKTSEPALRKDARQNVEKLTAAAVSVFLERGFTVPLEEVARAAGVSIGTLYNRFGNREALIAAAAPAIAEQGTDLLAAKAQAQGDPWARFHFFVTSLLELQAATPSVDDIMTRRYPESPTLAEHCEQAMVHAARFIQEAHADGSLRADFHPDDLTALLLANSGILGGSAYVPAQAWRKHLGFVLDGLRVATHNPHPA